MVPAWLVALLAGVSALIAVAIPRQVIADEIVVAEREMFSGMLESLTVEIDGRAIVVHAPVGYRIDGYGASNDEEVGIRISGDRSVISVNIMPGRGPDVPTVIGRGHVVWELVRGATITARSFDVDDAVLVAMLESTET